MFVGGGIVIGLALLAKRRLLKAPRKSPFTGAFLRPPGHTLSRQVDDAVGDVLALLMVGFAMPGVLVATVTTQSLISGNAITRGNQIFYLIFAFLAVIGAWRRLSTAIGSVQRLRLGYEGELAVGQELNQLMLAGYRVFHDFPADKFNIDHIVIGPNGVFAVETKARAKPDTGDGRKDALVVYDGQALKFPGWVEKEPLDQAARQAQWLSKWLRSAVGEPVAVLPVLAVPGWFIDRKKSGPVFIYNGKNPEGLFRKVSGNPVDAPMIQRIAHQIEAKCRDVVPRAYAKEEPGKAS